MRPSEFLGAVVALCTIVGFIYRAWTLQTARHEANKARMDDLKNGVEAHDKILDEIIFYLSLPESERKLPFNSRSAWKTLKRKAFDNYDGRNTSGFE
jgi:hypothetical protein